MLEPDNLIQLDKEISEAINSDLPLLSVLRAETAKLKSDTRQIRPQSTTSISLVGTDGGNNQVSYDPFMVQLIRVVDSSHNQYCLEALTPNSDLDYLNRKHANENSALWQLTLKLGLTHIKELSPVFKKSADQRSESWIQVYREITEWAVLLTLFEKDYGTDTLIIFDGFIRSKMFSKGLFGKFIELIEAGINKNYKKNKRKIYLVGLAKHTKVLQCYSLAMALEGAMRPPYACYSKVPDNMKERAYQWSESFMGGADGENFVGGTMYFVKFGKNPHDPVWAVDLLESQSSEEHKIFGYLLADAIEGFPVPFYPQSLQKAHENAAIVGFDLDIIQDSILNTIRNSLKADGSIMDELALQAKDPSAIRYS